MNDNDDTTTRQDAANFVFSRGPSGESYTLDDLDAFVQHARQAGVPGDSPVCAKTKGWKARLVELTTGRRVHGQHRGNSLPVLPAEWKSGRTGDRNDFQAAR